MKNDPIVAEVHQVREKLSAKFDFDLDAIFDDLIERQKAHGRRLVKAPCRSMRRTKSAEIKSRN